MVLNEAAMNETLKKLKLGQLEVFRMLFHIFESNPTGLSGEQLAIELRRLGVDPTTNIAVWMKRQAELIGLRSLLDTTQDSRSLSVHARSICGRIAAWLDEIDEFI